MNNPNNKNDNIPLNHFGSLPSLPNKSNSISPTFVDSRLLPKSAPSATLSSNDTVITEILVGEEDDSDTAKETNPTEVLGTLRMHYHDVTSWRPSYLQAFFKITNYTGFTPYRYTMHNQQETFGKMVPYILVAMLNILHSCRMIKILLLEAILKADDPDVRFYILLLRTFVQVIIRLKAIRTFMNEKSISSMMDRMDATSFSNAIHSKLKFWISTSVVLISFGLATAGTLYGFPNHLETAWSISSLLEFRSKEVEEFFVSTNFNQSIEILVAPAKPLDANVIIMGVLGCAMKFVGIAADQFNRYAILFSILILKQGVDEFNFDGMPAGLPTGMIPTPCLVGEQIKRSYNDLKGVSKSINDVFEDMIELFLLDSLLVLADFVGVIFHPTYSVQAKVLHSSHVITPFCIFHIALSISKKVRQFRDWLTSEPGPEKNGMSRDDIQAILNELATNPIGVGRDSLHTNKGFFIGYFGIATGYFFSTVETRATGCDCR